MPPRSFGRQWDKAGPDDLANKLSRDAAEAAPTPPVAPTTPRTEAGRRLITMLAQIDPEPQGIGWVNDAILAIEAEARSTPAEALDNQHPLIRAIADLPQQAGEPGTDYIKRGGALSVAIEYLRLSERRDKEGTE